MQKPRKLINVDQVMEKTGRRISFIYAGMKAGTFPKAVPIGKHRVSWIESEIDEWIEARIAERDGTADKAANEQHEEAA